MRIVSPAKIILKIKYNPQSPMVPPQLFSIYTIRPPPNDFMDKIHAKIAPNKTEVKLDKI